MNNINIVQTVWGTDMHNDLVQYKEWITKVFKLLKDTENELNTYKRGCGLQLYNQMLSNGTLNAIIIAYQNNINYTQLYQFSLKS